MKKISNIFMAGLVAALALASCTQKEELRPDLQGVSVNDATISLMVGETKCIDFVLNPDKALTDGLLWVSSDSTVAVANGGWVSALKDGSATIAVRTSSEEYGKVTVKVDKYKVTSVTLDATEVTLINGNTMTLEATVKPDNASFPKVSWSSSDPTVAEVDAAGKVTSHKAGTVVITATGDDGISASCIIHVIDADDFNINTSADEGSIAIYGGDQVEIKASGSNFLSYKDGVASWTENTTGTVRTASLELSSGSRIKVTQATGKVADFLGKYNFTSKVFSKDAGRSGITAGNSMTLPVTFATAGNPETLKDSDGTMYVNHIAIRGLLGDVVVAATLAADEEDGVKLGLFVDSRKAQKTEKGKAGFDYIAVLPGYGASFIGAAYQFTPYPVTTESNYAWIWFKVSEEGKMLRYANDNKQKFTAFGTNGAATDFYAIAISLVPCKTEEIAKDQLDSAWWVVYQANPNNAIADGLTFLKD
ncbi:MAG: Ig domain-containing protein [Bacteroidales bacterium]|nr:Ig domain-containing protein [Bacteroidales bacterium]